MQRTVLPLCIIGGSIIASSPSFANEFLLKPYIAIGRSQRQVQMVSGFGQELFPARMSQNELMIGFKLNEYFGVEGGGSFSETVTKTTLIPGATTQFGIPDVANSGNDNPNDPNDMIVTQNSLRFRNINFNLVGYLPILIPRTTILLKAGIEVSKVTAISRRLADNDGPLPTEAQNNRLFVFSSRTVVPKISAGIQYQLLDSLALQGLFGYVFTSKFKNMAPKNRQSIGRISFKNNTIASFGLVFQF
jgi:hypothetical protein